MKNKNRLTCGVIAASMFLSMLSPPVMAGTNVSVVKEFTVTSTDGTGIPSSIEYNEGGAAGTLQRSKILGYTVSKTRKEPVYRTDTESFERTVVKTNSSKNDSIFPSQHAIDENGYKGSIPRVSVSWKELIGAVSKPASTTVTKDVPVKDDYAFPTLHPYMDEDGYMGYISRTSLTWEEIYETLVLPKSILQRTTVTEKKVPESIPYSEHEYSGTLTLKDVQYTVTKTKQEPVYRTVNQNFIKTIEKRNVPSQDNTIFDNQFLVKEDGFNDYIPRTRIDWEKDYSTIKEQRTVYDVKSGLNSKDDSQFPSTKTYNMDGFTGILERKSVVYETYYVPVYRTETKQFTKIRTESGLSSKDESKFPDKIYINEDGYQGYISRTGINWVEKWEKNRKVLVEIYVDYRSDKLNPDYSNEKQYVYAVDPVTGQIFFGWINYAGISYVGSTQVKEEKEEEDTGRFHWMSNSSVYYAHGRWDDPVPHNPSSYYGKKGGTGWYAVSSKWISEVKYKDNPPWQADNGQQYLYAKQVQTLYKRVVTTYKTEYIYRVTFRGYINLPDLPLGYDGEATYSGTLEKQVVDHYDTKYEGTATYSGEVSKTVENGYKGTATYSGNLSKEVIDHYEEIPIEWEAAALYEGELTHTYIKEYKGTATYSGTVYKSVVTGYEGTALYQGNLSKQVLDHYEDVPIEWTASVLYEGYVNKPPVVSFDIQAFALIGEQVQVTNKSSDPDGTIKNVKWTVSPTGSHTGNLGTNGGTITFTKAGTYTVSLEVTDNDNVVRSTSKTITVYDDKNNLPVASFTIQPNPALGDDVINYINSSYDPDGKGIQTVVWTVVKPDGSSQTYTNTLPPRVFDAAGWEPGTYKVRLKVQDYGFSETIAGRTVTYPAKWSEEVEKILVVNSSLQVQSVIISDVVNPPKDTTLPVNLPVVSPVKVKAGYKITLILNTVGADQAELRFYSNGSRIDVHTDSGKQQSLVYNPVAGSQQVVFWFDNDMAKGSVVDMKIILTKTMPDGTVKTLVDNLIGWNFMQIVGSAKEDGDINLTN